MIVGQHDRRALAAIGELKDFTRVHEDRIQGALGDFLVPDKLPSRVYRTT